MRIINDDLRLAFRCVYVCSWCGKSAPECDPHHVVAKGMGGGRQLDIRTNLISVHRHCHNIIEDAPARHKWETLERIATREGCDPHDIAPVTDFILEKIDKYDNSTDPARLVKRVQQSLLTLPQRKLLTVELSEAVKMGATTGKYPLEWPLCVTNGLIVGLCGCERAVLGEPCF